MRIGVLGAGSVAIPHLLALKNLPQIDGIAVADVNPAALRKVRDLIGGLETTGDYRELIADPRIPLVDVCLPHHLHCPVTLEAFAAGKDVILEKPIALTLEEADRMIAEAGRRKRWFAVALNQMFLPEHEKARELIRNGTLGRPFLGVWKMIGDEFLRMSDERSWKCETARAGGGALFDTGTHAACVMLDLFGAPVRASAFARRILVECGSKGDDNAVGIVEFASGALVALAETYTARSEDWNERKYVYGSEASLEIDSADRDAPLTIRTNRDHAPRAVAVERMENSWEGSIARCLAHHLDCYVGGKPPLYGHDLAKKTLELILALYRSDRTGKAVRLS